MKQSFLILALILSFSGQVWAQDSLDFLDKVNEKPKTTTPATTTKPKEETTPVVGKKSNQQQATTSTKKKKSKKKNANALVAPNGTTNPAVVPSTISNINTATNPVVIPEPKVVPVETQTVSEEETTVAGLWLDPQVAVEPVGLPGFGGDASIGKVSVDESKTGTSAVIATTVPGKPLFSFSEFFDKYKKAMLILGVIVLFAFYRLRMTKSSSGSRPYRR